MKRSEFGVLLFDIVRSQQLDRPSQRLRFQSIEGKPLFPDLYDAALERISAEEFIFRGIEVPLLHGLAQHYAQAWAVSVNEPDSRRSAREFEEAQRARGIVISADGPSIPD